MAAMPSATYAARGAPRRTSSATIPAAATAATIPMPEPRSQPPSLSLRAETEVLGVRDLGPGEAIVHLGEVDVTRSDARHRVGLAGRRLRRAEAEVVEGRIEIRTPRGDGEADALHEDGVFLV